MSEQPVAMLLVQQCRCAEDLKGDRPGGGRGGRGKEPSTGRPQDPGHGQPQCELFSRRTMIPLWFQRIERGGWPAWRWSGASRSRAARMVCRLARRPSIPVRLQEEPGLADDGGRRSPPWPAAPPSWSWWPGRWPAAPDRCAVLLPPPRLGSSWSGGRGRSGRGRSGRGSGRWRWSGWRGRRGRRRRGSRPETEGTPLSRYTSGAWRTRRAEVRGWDVV